MSKETLSEETMGEGFAYFAWHRLRWPDDCAECRRHYFCHRLWHAGDR